MTVEIYLEFESSLAPLCKLNNFLDIVNIVKEINDISKSEGNLLNIWVIIHHNWSVHMDISNNHTYKTKNVNHKIRDFEYNHWYNRLTYKGR
jgi:hypothetical protein